MNAVPKKKENSRRPWPVRAPHGWQRLRVLLGVCAGFCCAVALADGLDGRFEVRSADLELKDGVFHLNARLDLPISDAVREGLAQGVPLALELDLSIERVRQMLPNSGVAELTQRYHLQYNAVSAHYILRNDNSGQQESVSDLDAALEQLSQVRGVPVLDLSLISADLRYEANVRAKLDYGAVPLSMRILMFWVHDWHRESDWYAWTFQP
jgi:predicted component of type VI protein secretion system